jgi:hypothetical protein
VSSFPYDAPLHLSDDKIGTIRLQTKGPTERIMSAMPIVTHTARERSYPTRLQLLPPRRGASAAGTAERADPPTGRLSALRFDQAPSRTDASPILVAGRDACQRAAVLDELTQTMPPSTVFEEVGEFCDVLERAAASRMVVLSGDLDDVPAESLMQKLAHRHPGLPVVSLDAVA